MCELICVLGGYMERHAERSRFVFGKRDNPNTFGKRGNGFVVVNKETFQRLQGRLFGRGRGRLFGPDPTLGRGRLSGPDSIFRSILLSIPTKLVPCLS